MAALVQYNPAAVKVTLGSVVVADYGFDTFIKVDPMDVIGEATVGANGTAAFSASSNRAATVELTLIQNSAGDAKVAALLNAQLSATASGKKAPVLAFSLYDSITKSTQTGDALFTDAPSNERGKTVGERVYKLVLFGGLVPANNITGS